ncbi:hypothetical protein Tco_1501808 [Tanacetum coccineum]
MLGAAGVQIPENNFDDLHSSREDVGHLETMSQLYYTNVTTGLGVSLSRAFGVLRSTSAVVVILVKGHTFPIIVKVNPRTCLEALRTQFKEFFASKRVNSSKHLNQCWQKDFKEYTFCEPDTYRRGLLENLDTLEAVIHRAVITYGRLQLQSQDVHINPVQTVDDRLSVSKSSWIESENNNALSKLVNETQLQKHESLVTKSTTLEANLIMDVNALDVGLAVTESNETNSYKQDTSSSSGTYITHVVDADIRPVND